MKISKREKIILGLTVLALVYAGVVFLFPAPIRNVSQWETDDNSTGGLVTEVVQSLARHHRTETEQTILEKARIPWPTDPFVTAAASPSEEREPAGKATPESNGEGFSFTGYVEIGTKRLAIINGEEYETGDRIAGSPFTVRNITPERVLLGDAGNRTHVIPMADGLAP